MTVCVSCRLYLLQDALENMISRETNYYSYGLFWSENNAVKNIRKVVYTRIVNCRYMYIYIADLRSLETNMRFF